jgi:hypothetical protein
MLKDKIVNVYFIRGEALFRYRVLYTPCAPGDTYVLQSPDGREVHVCQFETIVECAAQELPATSTNTAKGGETPKPCGGCAYYGFLTPCVDCRERYSSMFKPRTATVNADRNGGDAMDTRRKHLDENAKE